MRRFLTRNLHWKLLSLLLAFALWITMGHVTETATSVAARVQYKNLADNLDISSGLPGEVSLELRGPSRRLDQENLASVIVVLDFAHVQGPGERTFNITSNNVSLPLGVAFSRAIPAQVRLRFDHVLSREVPVEPRYSGAPPAGYELLRAELDPAKLLVRGPESHVTAVVSLQTDPIDLDGIVGERGGLVHVWTGDPEVQPAAKSTVAYKVIVQKTNYKDLHN
ncbi:MAG: CdaR family protein [Bryobacteraceae bacterium]|jgi:YbbR domain-containing protein